MKYIYLLIIFIIVTSEKIYCQGPREVAEKEYAELKHQIQQQSGKLKARLEKKDYFDDYDRALSIEFTLDTFMIEALSEKIMNIDYSTAGVINEIYRCDKEYDKLLNKYYKYLLAKLSKDDQEVLKKVQRNWIAYRDAEIDLIKTMSKDEYSGGGTIQGPITSAKILEVTKQRVFDIAGHLRGIEQVD